MEWKPAIKKEDGTVSIPESWLFLHYYEALNILFRMENSLRVFVYVILKNEFKKDWMNAEINISEEEKSTIANVAAKRISQAKGFGYLGYEINSPLMYLNSGELTKLIISKPYWFLFSSYFKGKKEIIQNKFEEIGTIRNSLAHFRPLKNDDVDLVKQNIKHTFMGIEECLNEMVSSHNVVPTNTTEAWYSPLINLSTDLCRVRLYQSKLQQWIRIEITYKCPIFRKAGNEEWMSYSILNLKAPAIVKNYENLASLTTYLTEHHPYASKSEDKDPNFTKTISLVFAYSVMRNEYAEIANQIKDLFVQIHNESELIKKDNLASGQLIESVRTYASFNKETKRWTVGTTALKGNAGDNDPTEYWGELGLYGYDFITASTKYPWMPSDISKEDDELPF